jgi:UDP-glucose 4-epimerase
MSKILVTGGAGFIGSHLVEQLVREGNDVIILDTLSRGNKLDKKIASSVNLVKKDIRDFEAVNNCTRNCEYIYHFAALLGVDIVADNPVETMEVEALGMKNIVGAALANNVKKIIYASTSGVYGKTAIEKSVSEDFVLDPRSSYSIAKRFNEIYLSAVYQESKMESLALRYFNVYGKRQDNRMVIPTFFEQALSNKPLTVYGSGNQTRDFTYVKDVVRATISLCEEVKGCDIFNICGKNEYSIGELAKKIKLLTSSESIVDYINFPDGRYDFEVERRSGSSKKLFDAVSYRPTTSLDDGLSNIYKSYQ